MRAPFISFEGVDGCGKSTQLALTADWLRAAGLAVRTTFEPGDHSLGGTLRRLLLSDACAPTPEAELLLFLADRAQHVREVILPALEAGQWVLCDRFTDSTLAYQLAGRGLDVPLPGEVLDFAASGLRPTLTLWLDIPVRQALARTRSRARHAEDVSRIDAEAVAFHERVRSGFRQLCDAEPGRMLRIDACGGPDAVQRRVRKALGRLGVAA